MNSIVSLIIPVYNAEKSIECCVISILEQTYNHIEVIIVNDGSTDNSEEIIYSMSKLNDNIKYVKQENSGVSVARNHGISVSSGDYIMFVDSDDWLEKDCVEKMVNVLEATNSDYCFSDWYVEKMSGTYIDYVNKAFNPVLSADLLYRFYIANRRGCAPWGKLYKRELITKNDIVFPKGLPYAEDYLFVLKYLSVAATCAYLNEPLVHYNCYQPGAGSKIRENYFELQLEIEKLKEQIVVKSTKYKTSDKELLKISKLESYVSALLYLQLLYKDFGRCYDSVKVIIKTLNNDCYMGLIKKSNLRKIEKLYAFLGLTRSVFGVTLLTLLIRNVKNLVRK